MNYLYILNINPLLAFSFASIFSHSDGYLFVLFMLFFAVQKLTLCYAMDYILPGSSVHGISQAVILEWIAIPSPGYFLNPGVEPGSPAMQADSLPSEPPGKP